VTQSENLDHIAYHEAGHAVAAWKVGFTLDKITLETIEHRWWATHGGAHYSQSDDLLSNAIVSLAGGEAQKVFAPGTALGDAKDIEDAKTFAAEYLQSGHTIEDMNDLVSELTGRAAELVSQHKRHIKAVAEALLKSPFKCLPGPAVKAILDSLK
jgi:ATP-dependent Zn protease